MNHPFSTLGAALLLTVCRVSAGEEASEWHMLKGRHFIVYYSGSQDYAGKVSATAEADYAKIMSDLSYVKRDDFWLWDKRVGIYIYGTRSEFVKQTAAPEWAAGSSSYKKKQIATFEGSEEFLKTVLLHEMTHLLFRDSIGFEGEAPLWLNEGLAQWEEGDKRDGVMKTVKLLQAQNRLMSLADLTRVDVQQITDSGKVREIYAQSASLVGYLMKVHGPDGFAKFCRELRDGKDINDALRFTYPDSIRSIGALESAWKRYVEAP
jgi:hypothetical protein